MNTKKPVANKYHQGYAAGARFVLKKFDGYESEEITALKSRISSERVNATLKQRTLERELSIVWGVVSLLVSAVTLMIIL